MRIVTADEINRALDYSSLIEALDEAFRADIAVPQRHTHMIAQPQGPDAKLLLMPAWTNSGERFIGCKVVSVFPDNAKRGLPSVYGNYLLMSGETGESLALLDGTVLTAWRTACASALASRYLSREDASHLVMIGAGALAPHFVRAHAAVRPIRRVTLWNRTKARAVALGFDLAREGFVVDVADDLDAAVGEGDIVSCATLSADPLVRGARLKPGAHVDLVGSFTSKMRECDDETVRRARIYVDTPAAAKESGDLQQPLARGVIAETDILGDLSGLCRGTARGRGSATEITLFKSAGTAIEDLAAALLVWKRLS